MFRPLILIDANIFERNIRNMEELTDDLTESSAIEIVEFVFGHVRREINQRLLTTVVSTDIYRDAINAIDQSPTRIVSISRKSNVLLSCYCDAFREID